MNKIRVWQQELNELDKLRYSALAALALIAAIPCIAALLAGETWSGLSLNFGTEMAGAFVTFIVFDRLIGRYEKREEETVENEQKKVHLLKAFGSQVNDVARRAAEEIRNYGWWSDGSLENAQLMGANLENTKLDYIVMHRAALVGTNLKDAMLDGADLKGSGVMGAQLQNASLVEANLEEAILMGAFLQGAVLHKANLKKANLSWANLQGANLVSADLKDAVFDQRTVLPDGSTWQPDIDLERFTNPGHPRFFVPDRVVTTLFKRDESS